jgi:acylphosphatase
MRLHVRLSGRVQGVGFRWFVRERARELRLAGWVRNNRDGSVEVAAEGDAAALARLRAALEHGPPGADVVAVDDLGPTDEEFEAIFTIVR